MTIRCRILPLLCVFLLLSGCIMSSDDENREVSMEIKDSSVTNTGLTYVISNQAGYELTYGGSFVLEMYRDGAWNQLEYVDGGPLWTAVLLSISPGKSAEHSVSWDGIYGSLEAGEYRLIKDVTLVKSDKNTDYQISARFSIAN